MKLLLLPLIIQALLMLRIFLRRNKRFKMCYNLGSTRGFCIDYVRNYKEGNLYIIEKGYQLVTPISGTGHYRATKRTLTANLISFLLCDAVYIQDSCLKRRKGILIGSYAILSGKEIINISK
ncbi:MAG: hypothetical protein ACRDDZ_01405 [Marinifilaceae bacterium]